MLYQRNFVEGYKPLNEIGRKIIRRAERLALYFPRSESEKFKNYFEKQSKARTILGKARYLSKAIATGIKHESHLNKPRKFKGLRTAHKTMIDREGHCYEINLALYGAIASVLPNEIRNLGLLFAKNPKGFDWGEKGVDDWGIHPFVSLNVDGKKYLADGVGGSVFPFHTNFHSWAVFNRRELISHLFLDASEDIAINHSDYEDALGVLESSLIVDENNYLAYVFNGEIRAMQGKHDRARKAYKKAIRMTPGYADCWKAYGDYLFECIKPLDEAREAYIKASEAETNDLQVLGSLSARLNQLGCKTESKKVWDKIWKISLKRGVSLEEG